MRTLEIKSGSVDVRHDATTGRYCLVFEASDAELRLYRVMSREEAAAFHEHLGKQLKAGGRVTKPKTYDPLKELRKELNRACAKCGELFAVHSAAEPHTTDKCDGFEERKPS